MTPLLTIALLVIVVLWFAVGIEWNVRRGNALLRWLQGGLPLLGERTTLRWLGSSVVELKITQPNEPFLDVEVLVVLEPRDVGVLWGWGRLHGRRDFLILRGRLPRPPRFEVEVGDRHGWTGRDALRRLVWSEWQRADWGDPNVQIAYSGGGAAQIAHRVWANFRATSSGIWRLSVRRVHPHVEVHLMPPDAARVGAERLIQVFRDLSHAAMTEA